jgi:glutathione synthase/RimK-type ligase-like ATP-grasp enzyme
MTVIAIHPRPGSFSDRWIEYGHERGIAVQQVDCYASDVMSRLASAQALAWHWYHGSATDLLMARHVIMAAEMMGLKVFPSTATCWHFDDKVAQKYLLEAVGAPRVPTHVFYDLDTALAWIGQTTFPKVFKLRRGAGSRNVRLVRDAGEARRLARKAFGGGFKPAGGFLADAPTRYRKARGRGDLLGVLRRLPTTLLNIYRTNAQIGRERGYVYFQEFIAGNTFDTRITVIGDRAFGFTRNVRPGDFRASGSGHINYELDRINLKCVETAFDVARKIGSQSMAFDFVKDAQGRPLIVEVSYAYLNTAVQQCAGHWDEALRWHEGHIWPEDAIIEDLLAACGQGGA